MALNTGKWDIDVKSVLSVLVEMSTFYTKFVGKCFIYITQLFR